MPSVTKAPKDDGEKSLPHHVSKWPGILKAREVVPSMVLLRRLEKKGYSPSAARKILERDFSGTGVWRSNQLRLKTKARLYASSLYYGDAGFLDAIRPVLEEQRPGIARVLRAIELQDAIDESDVTRLTAVRLDRNGAGRALARARSAIEEAGLGKMEMGPTGRSYLVRLKHAGTEEGRKLGYHLLARREAERGWLKLLLQHLRLQGIIEWNTPLLYDRQYMSQLFSGYAFSKIRPMLQFKDRKARACPVVFEILTRQAELFDVLAFQERIYRAGANPQAKRRILGIIGAPYFSREALLEAKKNGMMIVNFKEVFGKAALDMMVSAEDLFNTFTAPPGAPEDEDQSESATEKFIASITAMRNHPMVTELSGMAFESYACMVLQSAGYEEVKAGLKVKCTIDGKDTYRDCDATGRRSDDEEECRIVECKALNEKNEVTRDDVKYFFTETVPAYLAHVGKSEVDACQAEIWTTGTVSQDTRDYLESLALNKRIKRAIHTRATIPTPRRFKRLGKMLELLASL